MTDGRTVAIVDDDQAVRDTTARLLERAGYRVLAFESGDDFLASYLPGDVDCVVLDLRMPGTDGFGVLEALQGGGSMPPVLVLTGDGAISAAVDAMKLGAADFLEKPCPSKVLLGAIARSLASGPRRKPGAADPEAAARLKMLSRRQVRVLQAIVKGQSNKMIAYELRLSIRTVEADRAQLLEKLGVRGIGEAVRLAIAGGMLESG
jgi:FixJ family two-component response regulator